MLGELIARCGGVNRLPILGSVAYTPILDTKNIYKLSKMLNIKTAAQQLIRIEILWVGYIGA